MDICYTCISVECMSSVELIEVSTVLWVQLRTCSKLSGMCGDMCDVLYDVKLYCNVCNPLWWNATLSQ